jgi:hypothetical protein
MLFCLEVILARRIAEDPITADTDPGIRHAQMQAITPCTAENLLRLLVARTSPWPYGNHTPLRRQIIKQLHAGEPARCRAEATEA